MLIVGIYFSQIKVLETSSKLTLVSDEPHLVSCSRCQLPLHFEGSYMRFAVAKLGTARVITCVMLILRDKCEPNYEH